MSFVGKPFDHDVFVSYSHGDPMGAGNSLLGQWSQSFIRELEREMRFHSDAGATRLFLDQHRRADQALDPSLPVAKALQAEIERSAMMLVLMSPHYLNSDWCGFERRWWGGTHNVHSLDPWNRVAFARVVPIEQTYWPREFIDETGSPPVGHAFYDAAEDDPRPYGWPNVDGNAKENFRRALVQLSGELRRKLISVRKSVAEREQLRLAQEKLAAPAGQVVYLHGRETQQSEWHMVRDRLFDENFSVLPADPEPIVRDPKDAMRIRDDRVATMSGCDAVLLLGSEDGSALSADITVVGRLDRQQAVARSSRPLPCGVLDTKGVVTRRPDWQRLASSLGVQWLDAPLNEMAMRIRGWLAGVPA